MIIRPISDLRNHYAEVEKQVLEQGPVFLTKNGYGSMVVMSLDYYEHISSPLEAALDEADHQAETTATRYTHDEVFSSIREGMRHGQSAEAI